MARRKANRLEKDPAMWEQAWRETGNPEYGTLAVGYWGEDAPDWAITACRRFYLDTAFEVPGHGGSDNRWPLGRMSALMVRDLAEAGTAPTDLMTANPKMAVAEAARQVAVMKGCHVTKSRLEHLWKEERDAMRARGEPHHWPGLGVELPASLPYARRKEGLGS